MVEYLGRKYPLQTMSDTIFEVLCSQISADYISIIRSEIMPCIPEDLDIGVREIRMLLLIDHIEDLASSSFISNSLRYDPGTVTRASKRLVNAGFIARRKSKSDRRTLYFELTERGAMLANKYRNHIRNRYLQLESDSGEFMTHEERVTILNVLTRLRTRTEALVDADQRMPELQQA